MIRYLYWKQPTNPLLQHFEKTLVVKLFEDSKYIHLINNTRIRVANEVRLLFSQPNTMNFFISLAR